MESAISQAQNFSIRATSWQFAERKLLSRQLRGTSVTAATPWDSQTISVEQLKHSKVGQASSIPPRLSWKLPRWELQHEIKATPQPDTWRIPPGCASSQKKNSCQGSRGAQSLHKWNSSTSLLLCFTAPPNALLFPPKAVIESYKS